MEVSNAVEPILCHLPLCPMPCLSTGKRGNVDVDGMLPTNAFRRLFISHSGGYAILDPRLERSSARSRAAGSQKIIAERRY
jgi:hypothetical protein